MSEWPLGRWIGHFINTTNGWNCNPPCQKLHLLKIEKMKKIYLSVFTIALFFTGCGKSNSGEKVEKVASEEDKLYEQVMAIHDEVMPKMNDLHKLKKQLEEEIKNSPDLVEERKMQLENQLKEVNEASEAMMQWMRQFSPDELKTDKEAYVKYLNEQLEEVTKVKEDMLKALEQK